MASAPALDRRPDGLRTALSLLTVVPVGASSPDGLSANSGRRATKWFPLVGSLVGAVVWAVVAAAAFFLRLVGVDPLSAVVLAALLGAVADFTLTRGMHWDGLADVADAWWGGFDLERRQQIMSDSAVGTFGIFALVSAFSALVFGLSLSHAAPSVLLPAFAISRLSGVFAAQLGRPAKDSGLGRRVLAFGSEYARGARAVATWVVSASTCLVVAFGAWAYLGYPPLISLAAPTVVSVFAAAALPHVIASRMGGVTGDVIGASILASQVVAVLAFAIAL